MKKLLLTFTFFVLALMGIACTGGTNGGTITPTGAYQTVSVTSGSWYNVNVTCGSTYNFTFCSNGGSAAWDTQITINQTDNTTQLAYNDDFCGLQSNVSWTATFTGQIHVLVSLYNCNNAGGNTGTMAYNVTASTLNPAFTVAATGCTTASSTVTGTSGGTFSFNPVPGGGVSINASTGAITGGTPGATYTVQYSIGCSLSSTQNVTLPSTGNPAFSLSVICGGATANVTGTLGGSFTFNPAPGDGAQVNSSTGLVTNGTAGNTYFVQYTVCGSSSTQSVTVLDDNCWTLNGNAQYINVAGEPCIQLTAEVNNQTGCAWNGSQIDFASNFSLSLDYYFGNNINGADGNTFTFQTSASNACGQNGGQLGAGGIANSLAIEFDTYDNDFPTHTYDMSCDHIAVEIDGNMLGPGAPLCGPVCAKAGGGNIDDGGTYAVDIVWNAATQQLQIYFDGALRLTCTNNFITNAFGGNNMVYWGATSATGGLNNQQYFCPSTVVILPVEMTSFENDCKGDVEHFTWTTASEDRSDYFQLEYTYDGLVFYPAGIVDASGTSSQPHSYSFDVDHQDERQRYYRIKVVDENSDFEYSDIIASKRCYFTEEIITSAIESGQYLTIKTNEEATIEIYNSLGQIVEAGDTENHQFKAMKTSLNTGVYVIRAVSEDGGTQQVMRTMLGSQSH